MKQWIIALSVMGLVSGCAMYKPAEKKEITSEKVIMMPFDLAWSRIVAYTTKNGMNVKVIDKNSGLITFEKSYDLDFSTRYLDCGKFSEMAAQSYSPLTLNFSLQRSGDKNTLVRVNLFQDAILGNPPFIKKAGTCYSLGTFEREIFCEIDGKPCPTPIAVPTPSPTPKFSSL